METKDFLAPYHELLASLYDEAHTEEETESVKNSVYLDWDDEVDHDAIEEAIHRELTKDKDIKFLGTISGSFFDGLGSIFTCSYYMITKVIQGQWWIFYFFWNEEEGSWYLSDGDGFSDEGYTQEEAALALFQKYAESGNDQESKKVYNVILDELRGKIRRK